jgi:hypothetical protein
MFQNVKSDDTIFAKLLTDIEAAKTSKSKSYPEPLRHRILEYITITKITLKAFSARSGLSQHTIKRWMGEQDKSDEIVESVKKKKEEAVVVPPPPPPPPQESAVVVVAPPKEEEKVTIRLKGGIEVDIPIGRLAQVLRELQ